MKKENIWSRKIFGLRRKRKMETEKEKIFGPWRRRRTEKENIENIWRREVVFCGGEEERRKIWRIFGKENSFFVEEKKNEGGKGGKYNREENIVAGGRTGGRGWKA